MLKITQKQLQAFQQPVGKRQRQLQLQAWRDQGLQVKDDSAKKTITLIDKEEGTTKLIITDNGILLISGENRQFKLIPNQKGKLQSIISPEGGTIRFERDSKQRLITLQRGKNSNYSFDYDCYSHLRTIHYPDNSQLEFIHSPAGQLMMLIDRNQHTTHYRYSNTGQLKQQIDAKGNITKFEHSNSDSPSALIFPNGDRHEFNYDGQGNLDRIIINGKQHAKFMRDHDKGITHIYYANGGDVQFTVSGKSVVEASNENGTLKLAYDSKECLLEESWGGRTVEYQRNKLGSLIVLGIANIRFMYIRDQEQRVTEIRDWKGGEYRIQYAKSGALKQIHYPNDTKSKQNANILGLPVTLSIQSPIYPNQTIAFYEYTYDACDRVITERSDKRKDTFQYDNEGRLLKVYSSNNKYSEFFELDANGNCLKSQYGQAQFNSADQLQAFVGHDLDYDDCGNTIKCPTINGQTQYRYNGRNQLIAVRTSKGLTKYTYDPLGRRICKENKQDITHYVWAGQQLLAEKTVTRTGRLLSHSKYLFFPESSMPLAMCQDGEMYYFHTGRRGEVLCITNKEAEVVWQAHYSAFGIAHITVQKIKQPWRLAGHYYDNETGLHYVLARYYSPQLGRFLSRDPLFIEGGSHNFYLYCNADPLNKIDPSGEFIFTAIIVGAVVGAAIGAGIEAYRQSKAIDRGEQEGYDGWGIAKAGAVGGAIGAVGGGVGAAVEGALGVAAVTTIASGAGIGAVGGVASSVAEQCAEAALKNQPLDPLNVAKQAAIDGVVGAGIGVLTAGTGGFLARRARKGVQEGIEVATEHATKEASDAVSEKVVKEALKKAEGTIDSVPSPPKGGAARAARFGREWPTASLDDAIKKFAGETPNITITDKGKRIYTHTETGIQVVEDMNGKYFRIYDPSIKGKRSYLDMEGNIPNNKVLENGKEMGRSQGEYNQVTHFKILD